jgi:hypothetical protein
LNEYHVEYQWAPGIEIIAVRVTKPRIPDTIRSNFEQIEAEKAKLQVAIETQKVAKMNAETRKVEASIKAMQDLEVAEIEFRKQVKEVETQQTMQRIQNEVLIEQQKAMADSEAYRKGKEAESNAMLFTPEFLKYEEIKGVNSISKVYFGEKVPTYLADVAGGSRVLIPDVKSASK